MNSRRFILTPIGAEEIGGYQLSAFKASHCCIAMRRRGRGLLRVIKRRADGIVGAAEVPPKADRNRSSAEDLSLVPIAAALTLNSRRPWDLIRHLSRARKLCLASRRSEEHTSELQSLRHL